jgi:radical SAM superfamily enzyme YgiQ (UPF0313 family)
MNILLLYPENPETFWSFSNALKFVGKKACNPPLGLITVAAMLPEGWTKKLIDLNVSSLNEKQLQWADLVLISAMIIQRDSTLTLIERCKAAGKTLVAGGPLFTCEPDRFEHVDHLILNEAEITLPQFLEDWGKGEAKHIYRTDEFPDITQTPAPQWDLLEMGKYDSMDIQFSRGCPFNCDFCNVTALLGHVPRVKSANQIITELDALYKLGWRRSIFFVDDNFIGNKKILKQEILPALIEWRKDKSGCLFVTEASVNLADDEELMDLMVRAGFRSVFIGIETPDTEALAACGKLQNNQRDLLESVHRMQRKGLQVMAGFIVGFDSDQPDIFQRQIDFINASGILTAMVGLLQAIEGTELYDRLKTENRILDVPTGDNVDGSTNIVTRMPAQLLAQGYKRILGSIFSMPSIYDRIRTFLKIYQLPKERAGFHWEEARAFLTVIWRLGILSRDRSYFWRNFLWILREDAAKFPLAITLAVYGYHFNKIARKVIGEKKPTSSVVPVDMQGSWVDAFSTKKGERVKIS